MSRSSRHLILLLLALLAAHSGSLAESPRSLFCSAEQTAHEDACQTPCPGETETSDCPPDCQLCVCCPAARPLLSLDMPALWVPLVQQTHCLEVQQLMPSADPHDVFHVPKHSLA